ncbi:MAG: cell division protein FtsN [Polaribacter sp.]|jgi:cell division protein FtsN
MARDYAKKKKSAKKGGASRSNKKQNKPIGLILLVVLLVAGLIALLVYLKWYQPTPLQKIQAVSNPLNKSEQKTSKAKKPSTKKPKVLKAADDEVPFYRTHQEMMNKTVEIPIEDLKLPEDEHQYSYTMPCGSFREKSRADELKAQIAFTGHESKILPVKSKSELWHRVTLGPYSSKRTAESIRHRLQDNGFINCKIWRKQIK